MKKKKKVKKQEDQFLGALLILLAASVVQPSELGEQEEDTWIKNFSSALSFK